MTSDLRGILLDCDYIIALMIPHETTHLQARKLNSQYHDVPQYILAPVLYELATVCSRKFDHAFACGLLKNIQASSIQELSLQDVEKEVWATYYAQTRKSTSLFDCANLVAAKYYGLRIASFDQFYPKSLRVA